MKSLIASTVGLIVALVFVIPVSADTVEVKRGLFGRQSVTVKTEQPVKVQKVVVRDNHVQNVKVQNVKVQKVKVQEVTVNDGYRNVQNFRVERIQAPVYRQEIRVAPQRVILEERAYVEPVKIQRIVTPTLKQEVVEESACDCGSVSAVRIQRIKGY